MQVEWTCRHEVGPRKWQEDSFLVHEYDEDVGLFVLADGMGGLSCGRAASEVVCEVVRDELGRLLVSDPDRTLLHFQELVESAVKRANSVLYRRNREEGREGNRRMGSTCVALVLTRCFGVVAHVGDSRAYRFHEGGARLLTVDHTMDGQAYVQGIRDYCEGVLCKSEIPPVVAGNGVLLRAMGLEETVQVDTRIEQARPGDLFMLVSDGMCYVDIDEMYRDIHYAVSGGATVRGVADRLMCLAQDKPPVDPKYPDGLVDNTTVLLAAFLAH